jgi:hypothetical protein
MDSAKLNDWMQVFGIFAVVASLIFVGMQMRLDREIGLSEIGLTSAGSKVEMFSLENEHADIWTKGNSGEHLTGADAAIYENLISNRANRAFWDRQSGLQLGRSGEIGLADFVTFLHLNPGARKQWEHLTEIAMTYRKAQYPDYEIGSFGARVREQLKRLDDLGIE